MPTDQYVKFQCYVEKIITELFHDSFSYMQQTRHHEQHIMNPKAMKLQMKLRKERTFEGNHNVSSKIMNINSQ